jgi:L-lactate dehydrogenase complex protein LldG
MSPMSARDEILARIQRAFPPEPRSSADDHAAIARTYVESGTLEPEARLDLFEERLRGYGAEVYRCAPAQLPEMILRAMHSAAVTRLVAAKGIAAEWLPHPDSTGVSFVRNEDLGYDDLNHSQGVLTTCSVAIALTGTVILCHAHDGRRALTLIPDYHLCIVGAAQVVETVPEAIRAIENPSGSPITTISGPSATSDIEMTRIQGVHGPRRLAVILVLG